MIKTEYKWELWEREGNGYYGKTDTVNSDKAKAIQDNDM